MGKLFLLRLVLGFIILLTNKDPIYYIHFSD